MHEGQNTHNDDIKTPIPSRAQAPMEDEKKKSLSPATPSPASTSSAADSLVRRQTLPSSLSRSLDQNISSNSNNRQNRSLSDSWQFWSFPSAWFFERSHSLSSSRERAHINRLASLESRRLISAYDSSPTPNLRQHEHYKQNKWGEDDLCQVDLDTADINIDLSLADSIRMLPFSETVAQCVVSYSKFFFLGAGAAAGGGGAAAAAAGRRARLNTSGGIRQRLPPLFESNKEVGQPGPSSHSFPLEESSESEEVLIPQDNSTSTASITANDSLKKNHPQSEDTRATAETPSPMFSYSVIGELAVPRVVQDALDYALGISYSAGKVMSAFLLPPCPRRARGGYDPESTTSLSADSDGLTSAEYMRWWQAHNTDKNNTINNDPCSKWTGSPCPKRKPR